MENIQTLLSATKKASIQIARLSAVEKTNLVEKIATAIENQNLDLVSANKIDADKLADDDPKKDRLVLNAERIGWMVNDARSVATLEDPSGKILTERTLENGVRLQKLAVPMGVVGIIYESRPNVTLDAICLALKSGNAVVLRGGSDAENSNKAIVKVVHEVLNSFEINTSVVQLLPTDRKFVQELLEAEKYVDLLIPRGSQGLINFVREKAKIPTIETGAGVCHTLVEKTANLEMAKTIVCNAKLQRPSVCNALDTVLVFAEIAKKFLPTLMEEFAAHKTEIYADERAFEILKNYCYKKTTVVGRSVFFNLVTGLT